MIVQAITNFLVRHFCSVLGCFSGLLCSEGNDKDLFLIIQNINVKPLVQRGEGGRDFRRESVCAGVSDSGVLTDVALS